MSRRKASAKRRGARSAAKPKVKLQLGDQARFALTLAVAALFIWALFKIAQVDTGKPNREHTNQQPAHDIEKDDLKSDEYTFYSLLKDFKIEVPDSPELADTQTQKPISYLIQAGSFRTEKQAEQRRAELILLGLDARVEKNINSRSELWYRIMLGPFESRSAMASARSKLISNRYDALVMKR